MPHKVMRGHHWGPYLLLLPSTLYLALFFLWPMAEAVELAFKKDGAWTLAFLERMVRDVNFSRALITTLVLALLLIPLQFVLALAMALLIHSRVKGASLSLYALPLAISDLAAGIIWFCIFTERGYLNSVLWALGLSDSPHVFLSYQTLWPLVAVLLAELWRATSLVMVILLAGLQSIPKEYDEAAQVFGAGWLQRLWHITLPLLRPSIQVALILRTILALQAFAVVLAVAGQALTVLAAEAYRWYSSWRNPHVAAAYAALIMLLSFGITLLYLRALRTEEPWRA